MMTGPAGKVMLLPEEDPSTDYIMVATGTGIAPYRGFIRRLFVEDTPAGNAYKGEAWLFLGVANSDALLYDDEWQAAKKKFPDNFRLDYALSREQENKKGGKMYIQDKVEEYADEVFTKLDNGAHIYFCGLKGMMPGIQDMLKSVCDEKGIAYDEWVSFTSQISEKSRDFRQLHLLFLYLIFFLTIPHFSSLLPNYALFYLLEISWKGSRRISSGMSRFIKSCALSALQKNYVWNRSRLLFT